MEGSSPSTRVFGYHVLNRQVRPLLFVVDTTAVEGDVELELTAPVYTLMGWM